MKKSSIINLIKYFAEKNDVAFRAQAYEIAREFDRQGDYQLTEYILALLAEANTFIPQVIYYNLSFAHKADGSHEPLHLPEVIKDDVIGIINAANSQIDVNKFLFQGEPDTGKTVTAKHLARILERQLYIVDSTKLIDCKLGQTAKNVEQLFVEINSFLIPEKSIILLEDIDVLALKSANLHNSHETQRIIREVVKGLDSLNDKIIFIASTNAIEHLEQMLVRKFDSVIDFNRYTRDDLLDIAQLVLNHNLDKVQKQKSNLRLFNKIMELQEQIPYPGKLKKLIKTSLALSNVEQEFDYLRKLYNSIVSEHATPNLKQLHNQGFTVREIEIITGISKSQVSRKLQHPDE